MDFSAILRTINWKTTSCAVAYLLCNIIGGLYPYIADVCSVLDKVFLALGIATAADSTRTQNIVQAVDHLYAMIKVDPATIPPADVKTVPLGTPMTMQSWVLSLILAGGLLSLTACSALPFGSKEQITSLVNVYAAGQYQVVLSKDGKQLYTENWTCAAVEGKLPVCHLDGTRTTSIEVGGQVKP